MLPVAYVWAGLWAVEVFPSPKFQLQDAMVPSLSVLASVNRQASSVQSHVKFALGDAFYGGGGSPAEGGELKSE